MNKLLLIKLWIILFTTLILIGGIKTVYAVTIIPTIYCIGGSAQPPCAPIPTDVSPTISGSVTQTQTTLSPTNSTSNPTTTPTGGINNQITPTAAAPCTPVSQSSFSDTGSVATFRTHHKPSMGGLLSQFFQFLLQLFQLLLQLIGSNNPCLIGTPTTTPVPTVIAGTTPGVSPSSGVSNSPTNGTTPSTSPSSGVSGNPTTNPSPSGGSNVNNPAPATGTGSGNGNGSNPNNGGSSGGSPSGNGSGSGSGSTGNGSSNGGQTGSGSSSGPGSNTSSGTISPGNTYSPDKRNPQAVQPGDGNSCPQYFSYCKGSGANTGLCIPNAGSCYAVVKPTNGFYCGDHTYQQYTPPTGTVSDKNRGVCKVCPRLASVKSAPNKTTGATSCTCNDTSQVVSYNERSCVDKIVGCAASGYSDTNGVCTKCVSGYQLQGNKCVKPSSGSGSGKACDVNAQNCASTETCYATSGRIGVCRKACDVNAQNCMSTESCVSVGTSGRSGVCVPKSGGSSNPYNCSGLTYGSCSLGQSCVDSPSGYLCKTVTSAPPAAAPACTKRKSGEVCSDSSQCCSNSCKPGNSVGVAGVCN